MTKRSLRASLDGQDARSSRLQPLIKLIYQQNLRLGAGQLKFMGAAPGDPTGTNRLITLNLAQLNNIYSNVGINPAALAVFANASSKYPANDPTVSDGLNTGGFRFNAPTTDNDNTHIARFDLNVNDRQSLIFRGNYQHDLNQLTSYFPDSPSRALWEHPYGFVVGHNWTVTNKLINNFQYGFTRQAFSQQGDSTDNAISFRFVYQPLFYARTLSRITPVHNITDDLTYITGNHTVQFGGNVRIVRNEREYLGNTFDAAVTNPSFYNLSGRFVDQPAQRMVYRPIPKQERQHRILGGFSTVCREITTEDDFSNSDFVIHCKKF